MTAQKRTLRDLPRRPGMRAGMIIGTVMYALGRGVPMEHITAATGLCEDDLSEQDGWLPEAIMPALWRLIAQANPGEAVALSMAAAAPMSHFGPLAHACRYAQDGLSSMQAFVRYRFTLSDNLTIELHQQSNEARLSIYHPMDERDGGHGDRHRGHERHHDHHRPLSRDASKAPNDPGQRRLVARL